MIRCETRGQIGEERCELTLDLQAFVSATDARHVLLAHLLSENQSVPQGELEPLHRARHDVAHHARALAVANYQPAKPSRQFGWDVTGGSRSENCAPHRGTARGRLSSQRGVAIE